MSGTKIRCNFSCILMRPRVLALTGNGDEMSRNVVVC